MRKQGAAQKIRPNKILQLPQEIPLNEWESAKCCLYVIRFERLETNYALHLNPERDGDDRFSENFSTRIVGSMIAPKIKGADQARVIISADRSTKNERIAQSKMEQQIGSIILRKDTLCGELTIPFESYQLLLPSLSAGQVEILMLFGEVLKGEQTRIAGIRFRGKDCPDEYQFLT
ncbi:MAG: hypothetical protein NTY60_09905 [Proteobacteria bacterium]|nr:hypothetical protein [Pseudomonadota bacterium]